jgi:iron complex outermembrane receptor protein
VYGVDVLQGTLTPRLDSFWSSKVAWSTEYTHLDEPAISIFNVRLTYHNEERDFEVVLGVTNLTDKEYFLQKTVFILGLGAGANIGRPWAPREWYLSVGKRF